MSADDRPGPWEVSPSNLNFVEQLYLAYQEDPARVDPHWRRAFERVDRGEPLWPLPPEEALAYTQNGGHSGLETPVVSPPPSAPNGFAGRPSVSVEPSFAVEPSAALSQDDDAIPSRPLDAGDSVPVTRAEVAAVQHARQGKRVRRLIEDFREVGHLSADLDPLGLRRGGDREIHLQDYGLTESDLDSTITSDVASVGTAPLREVLGHLEETYCRHIGVEFAHIHDNELRSWLVDRVETTRNRLVLSRVEKLHLLSKVIEAEVFEHFLQTKFLGAKRFSLEGAETLIPMVDRIINRASASGVSQIVIGMPHRGRLNMLANVLAKPASGIFSEFLDKASAIQWDPGGDVKYHLGFSSDRATDTGRVHISLTFNPSHLEAVNTVVQGRLRAKQDRMKDATRGLPILIHGDAAFAGQGIVFEGFNMSGLPGYTTYGTIHIVVNNQIGFTATPPSSYSTTYPTDVGRMLQVPIFHVNGEDPEAVAQVVDMAVDFRQRFGRDVIIDMWCYRKLGHNEGDEPSYTQPLMYRRIKKQPPVREAYVAAFEKNLGEGEAPITRADADAVAAERKARLEEALESAKSFTNPPKASTFAGVWSRLRGGRDSDVKDVETNVPLETVQMIGRALTRIPEGFTGHPKLKRLLKARLAMAEGNQPVDWGMGEALAIGTLLVEGTNVRFSGQDSRRGTFSHRHATLTDYETGAEHTPLAHLQEDQGLFSIYDSCLSEFGVLGFEFGYSLDSPESLVVWEAQFGDFLNGAQVIVDQFLVSSEAKWNRVSGITLLLPHGMEGQGPEHSSARLERFLNMCVNDNMQVCNVTTPAQFFHLLRRQVVRPYRKPLIVMSPKSLLRHPAATSPLSDFTKGGFKHMLPDETADPNKVDRILLCSGKVYYDLVAARAEHKLDNVAIVRLEQFYPVRLDMLLEELSRYQAGIRLIWVQEEARNMGAWNFIQRYYRPLLVGSFRFGVISRPQSSSPATGSATRHKLEHTRLVQAALGLIDEVHAHSVDAEGVETD